MEESLKKGHCRGIKGDYLSANAFVLMNINILGIFMQYNKNRLTKFPTGHGWFFNLTGYEES